MARIQTSQVVRAQVAHLNEAKVRAESSLRGERTAAGIRLSVLTLIGLGMNLTRYTLHLAPQHDPIRLIAIALYAVFSATTLFVVLRKKVANERDAVSSSIIATLVDCAFYGLLAWRDLAHGNPSPERLSAALAITVAFSVGRISSWLVVFSSVTAALTYLGMAALGVRSDWYSTAFVIAAFLALGGLLLGHNQRTQRMFVGLRRRDALTRFLPRQVAERVMKYGEGALLPVQREVTVLFSDIRGFTAMSEHMAPGEVLAFLHEYFGHMAQLVKAHDGIVNKFLGDGMLAVWGVPERNEAHALGAVKAALDMLRVVEELNAVREVNGQPRLRIGIGLHTGVAAAGMLGGSEQHEYTVIGDAVNLASRIEGLTKRFGQGLLVSERTWELVRERVEGERVAEEKVKGREAPVVIYAVRGTRASTAAPPADPLARTA